MEEVKNFLENGESEEMKKVLKKSKNYNKFINCDRCGKKIRDDRLRDHQISRNCKSEHAVYLVDMKANSLFINMLKENGFKIKKSHITLNTG
jgi:RNA polymerase-binding transcription factor DksA